MNATKLGMTAKTLCLSWENPEELAALRREYHRYYKPKGRPEKELVDQIVDYAWRLRRAQIAETAMIEYHKNSNVWDEMTYTLDGLEKLSEKRLVSFPNHGPVQSQMYNNLLEIAQPVHKELFEGNSSVGKAHIDAADDLIKLARYETTLSRNFGAARQELRQLQNERREHEKGGVET
jgi:hypothetical protein